MELEGTFSLGATPPSGTLAIGTTPRQARYRFPSQPAGVLTGGDPSTGGTATLSLDPPNRAVTLQEQGRSRTVTIAAGNWFSLGFGNTRFTLFRFAEEDFSLFGFVFAQGGSAQGYVSLTDGVARQARYALTGEAATAAAQFVYLHSDPLGTPRLATDTTQTVLWRWEGEAFGKSAANEDPDGDGIKIPINLRFPGQYHDRESGLYYNWNRYYDPKIGRYITSDPIGLESGQNTYSYVTNNPLRFTDPNGLFVLAPALPAIGKACAAVIGAGIGLVLGNQLSTDCGLLDFSDRCYSDDDECKKLYAQITAKVNELKKRYSEIIRNPLGLPPDGPMSVGGHQQQFQNQQANLRWLLNQADSKGCTNYQSDAWEWATKPTPSPGWGGPR